MSAVVHKQGAFNSLIGPRYGTALASVQRRYMLKIDLMRPEELGDAVRLFVDAVHQINRADYAPEQLDAWAPDDAAFRAQLQNKLASSLTLAARRRHAGGFWEPFGGRRARHAVCGPRASSSWRRPRACSGARAGGVPPRQLASYGLCLDHRPSLL